MKNKLEQIVEHLPNGLSETGIDEICSLVDEVVEERVEQELTLLEAKTISFINANLEQLKEAARSEVLAELKEAKELSVLNQVRDLIASVSDDDEVSRVSESYEKKIKKLEEQLKAADQIMVQLANEKDELTEMVTEANSILESLEDENELLQENMNIRLSDTAVMISRDKGLTEEADSDDDEYPVENPLLTEEVISLSLTD